MEETPANDPKPGLLASLMAIASAFIETLVTRWSVLLILLGLAWVAGGIAKTIQAVLLGPETQALMGVFGLDIVPTAFFTAAAAHAVLWAWRPTIRECLEVAARAFAMMLLVLVIYRLAFIFGLAMLILPGLAVIVLFTFAPVIVMAERPGVVQSFLGSWHITRRNIGPMVGGYILFLLACLGGLVIGGIAAATASIGLSDALSSVVQDSLLSAVFSLLHISFAASAYKALVGTKPD
ncbi:MAG: YciC family protein [Pseudomonadota bacterium]